MRPIAAALLALLPAAAAAHPGHVAEQAGHDHWIALGALAAAFAVTGWAWWRGRRGEAARGAAKGRDPRA
jgi:hypothetical protein